MDKQKGHSILDLEIQTLFLYVHQGEGFPRTYRQRLISFLEEITKVCFASLN